MAEVSTPWRRVFERFEVSQTEFARMLGRHKSKVSRVLADPEGLINGRDQKLLLKLGKERGVKVEDVLLPK